MCGIIGYTGNESCYPILKRGLQRLEYRGYDSSGVCFGSPCGKTEIYRQTGTGIENLSVPEKIRLYTCGMAHTRWATHGSVCVENAHPHKKGKTVTVHNGIIENYSELKAELKDSYVFSSSTDTEVLCALIDSEYGKNSDPVSAVTNAVKKAKGSFALGIIFEDLPGQLFAVRRDSPLMLGRGKNGMYAASDMAALSDGATEYFIPEQDRVCRLTKENIEIYFDGVLQSPPEFKPTEHVGDGNGKNGYPHYMLKEINETHRAISDTVQQNVNDGVPYFPHLDSKRLEETDSLTVVACGTAMHAGLCAKWLFEKLCRIKVNVCIASEYRYSEPITEKGDTVLFISQSGETADTVGAMRYAKSHGAYTLGMVNVRNSTLERECDSVIRTCAGAEIAVASTKAYSAQLAALWLLGFRLAYAKGRISEKELKQYTEYIKTDVHSCISEALEKSSLTEAMAKSIIRSPHVFFIGRGLDSVLCTEASLKLKEISYIHSEACPAGELKHGTISLISEDVSTVVIATQKSVFEKTLGNIKEITCRGGKINLICAEDFDSGDVECQNKLTVPSCHELFYPFPTAVLFQQLAYHASVLLGRQVDKPRNLAKSVTVE